MKKVIATLLATALILPVAAQAQPMQRNNDHAQSARYAQQNRGNERRPQAAPPRQQQAHRFARGERFDRNRSSNYRRLDYRQVRRLSAPGRNQVWVRSGDDALLVSLNNNKVQRVVQNVF